LRARVEGWCKARLRKTEHRWPTQRMVTAILPMGQGMDTTSHTMVLDLTMAVDLPTAGRSRSTHQTTMMPVPSTTIIMIHMAGLTGLMDDV